MNLILLWIVNTLAVLLAAYIVPGIAVDSFARALLVALLLGVLNVTLKPLLIILTLPATILTLGLFLLVINGFVLWFIGTFVEGFQVNGFFPAVLGALVISVVAALGRKLIARD